MGCEGAVESRLNGGGRLDGLISRRPEAATPQVAVTDCRDSDQPRAHHDVRPCSVICDTGSGNQDYCQVIS